MNRRNIILAQKFRLGIFCDFVHVLNFPALLCALGNFAVWRENSEENF